MFIHFYLKWIFKNTKYSDIVSPLSTLPRTSSHPCSPKRLTARGSESTIQQNKFWGKERVHSLGNWKHGTTQISRQWEKLLKLVCQEIHRRLNKYEDANKAVGEREDKTGNTYHFIDITSGQNR